MMHLTWKRVASAAFAGLLGTVVSCTSGIHAPAGKGSPPQGSKPKAAGAVGSSAGPQLPKTLPPASIFIGSSTWRTVPSRYCLAGLCRPIPSSSPKVIDAPDGSPVFFSLSAAPVSARLEIHPLNAGPDAAAKVVPLDPGTAMVWQASMPEGTYPLTLIATYKQSEVAWPFSVHLSPARVRRRR
ncbi:MAG: hypothetical protein NVSMB57_02920 [Actinomycetota bacterium]